MTEFEKVGFEIDRFMRGKYKLNNCSDWEKKICKKCEIHC